MGFIGFFLLLLPVSHVQNVQKYDQQNYVEIEIKYLEENHMQLFVISEDSVPYFTEKQSYWKKVTTIDKFETVRWNLREVQYSKFRIDLSVKTNQTIEIRSVTIHFNQQKYKLKGKEILNLFQPTVFLKLISLNNESIVFESTTIDGITDPGIVQINSFIKPVNAYNTFVKLEVRCSNPGILSVGLKDNQMNDYGAAIIIDSITTLIEFPLELKSRPTYISIQPSISNENMVSISNISLTYKNEEVKWSGKNIARDFEYNGEYYQFESTSKGLVINTKNKAQYSTFTIWNSELEFLSDVIKRFIKGFSILIFSSIFFLNFTKYLLN